MGLLVFPGKELHELLDVRIHQINAHHLASVGPHADDKIYPGNTIDNQETTVVASDREPNRPAQVNGRCRPLACRTRCSPPRAQKISRRAYWLSDPDLRQHSHAGLNKGRGQQFGAPRGVLPSPGRDR